MFNLKHLRAIKQQCNKTTTTNIYVKTDTNIPLHRSIIRAYMNEQRTSDKNEKTMIATTTTMNEKKTVQVKMTQTPNSLASK